jgi:hypothetical protein
VGTSGGGMGFLHRLQAWQADPETPVEADVEADLEVLFDHPVSQSVYRYLETWLPS